MTTFENDLHLDATELRLGLPGAGATRGIKRILPEINATTSTSLQLTLADHDSSNSHPHSHTRKEQIVGWPPVRSYRKNCMEIQKRSENGGGDSSGMFVKVSMDGAPYLRKIDLKVYQGYPDLVKALEIMFKCTIDGYNGSEYTTTYEDKDGDWMLAGDVPWDMFVTSCNRVRIMRGSEAKGLESTL